LEDFNNIKDFLQQEKFNHFNMIHINIMNYGDCNNVLYEEKLLQTRFHTPILPLDWKKNYNHPENDHISSIVRGNIKNIKWNATPHTPNNIISCCDANGNSCSSLSPFLPFDFTYAHFKHYTTKTIDEFINNKVKRGYPDGNKDFLKKNNFIKEFFKVNEITDEKIEFIKKSGYGHLL